MSIWSRPAFRLTGALLAAGVLVLGTQTTANARQSSAQKKADAPPVIAFDVTTDGGFSMPTKVQSGLVTFRGTSPEDAYHAVQGFYLKPGATLAQAQQDIVDTFSEDPATAHAGLLALYRDIVEIGGIVTSVHGAQEVTIPLDPRTYYFVDLGDPQLRYHTLKAVGRFQQSTPPEFTSVIEATMIDGEPRFRAPSTLAHDATFLNVVTGDEFHETVFRPVVPGTTDQYITDYYNAILAGTPIPPRPWTGVQAGLQSLSPGRWAIVHIDLPPGPYALICYVPSDENGVAHGWMGMHQVMNLT
ncbi:MAG: hypothetical protein M3P23_14340 [Actinomycetota bacterium]|nr:hypothetical protein [Actinomycetota bacterium]